MNYIAIIGSTYIGRSRFTYMFEAVGYLVGNGQPVSKYDGHKKAVHLRYPSLRTGPRFGAAPPPRWRRQLMVTWGEPILAVPLDQSTAASGRWDVLTVVAAGSGPWASSWQDVRNVAW